MEELSEFGEKFKEIFDLCDLDKDGYIDVKHFIELAKEHFGAEGTSEVCLLYCFPCLAQSPRLF